MKNTKILRIFEGGKALMENKELNDALEIFNKIKVGLASDEKVREWS